MKKLILAAALAAMALAPAPAKDWPGFTRGMGIGGWLTNYKRFNVLPESRRLKITVGDLEHFDTYITERDIANIKAMGFDHVVANMFFLPTGLLLNSMGIGAEGAITMGGILFNLSAATLGNIVGGVLVGMAYWYIYAKRAK